MELLKFTIHNLLSLDDEGYSGPMGPVLFAKEMMSQVGLKFNRLARIYFEDDEIFQNEEEYQSLTAHDILIIGQQFTNRLWLSLWIDEGIKGLPVAKAFTGEPVTISKGYQSVEYAKKLTDQEIEQIFSYLFANPHEIDPTS